MLVHRQVIRLLAHVARRRIVPRGSASSALPSLSLQTPGSLFSLTLFIHLGQNPMRNAVDLNHSLYNLHDSRCDPLTLRAGFGVGVHSVGTGHYLVLFFVDDVDVDDIGDFGRIRIDDRWGIGFVDSTNPTRIGGIGRDRLNK